MIRFYSERNCWLYYFFSSFLFFIRNKESNLCICKMWLYRYVYVPCTSYTCIYSWCTLIIAIINVLNVHSEYRRFFRLFKERKASKFVYFVEIRKTYDAIYPCLNGSRLGILSNWYCMNPSSMRQKLFLVFLSFHRYLHVAKIIVLVVRKMWV